MNVYSLELIARTVVLFAAIASLLAMTAFALVTAHEQVELLLGATIALAALASRSAFSTGD